MTYLNEITAAIAIVLQMLVIIGYWPHVRNTHSPATGYLAKAIFLVGIVIAMRISYNDLWRAFEVSGLSPISTLTQLFNAAMNTVLSVSYYFSLKALEQSVVDEDRADWPWWKVAFYPPRCTFTIRRNRN